MRTKNWFKTSPYWFKGGVIGAGICVALFVLYIFVWFPVVDHVYVEQIARSGSTPAWTTNVPMFTGHLFVFFSEWIVDGSRFCKGVIPYCTAWTGGGVCTNQIMAPAIECTEAVTILANFVFSILLVVIYVLIGALIGLIYGKFKNRKHS